MILQELRLETFRNLQKKDFHFSDNKNLIHGHNGAGKTSVLEAIFILGFGRSFLNIKKADIIQYEKDQFLIQGKTINQTGVNEVSAHYGKQFLLKVNDKKSNLINVNRIHYPVYFSSANYNLQIESKPHLRRMVNRFIFGVSPLYMHYILCYNKALRQKNHLLKTRQDQAELSSWNKIMTEMTEKIMDIRNEFVTRLNSEITERFNNDLLLEYIPSLKLKYPLSSDEIYQKFEQVKFKESQHCQAQIGPHLDNFRINKGGKNLKFNSSGEKKIHLLMIYIAFIELFKKSKQEYPIFLIDDFDTAIDTNNIQFLIDHYPEMQIIATSVKKHKGFDRSFELKKEN